MANNIISKTHTSCKDCIFARYDGKTQGWCNANYLENDYGTIKHVNGSVIEVQDENKEFFVVDGIYCYGKRKKKWGDRIDENKWLDQLKIENKLFYQVIIFVGDSFEDLKITMKSLMEQNPKPIHITAVRPFDNKVKPTKIVNYFTGIDARWNIKNIANPDLTNEQIIDMVIESNPMPYYSVFKSGFKVPKKFFKTIDKKIYNNTLKFAVLLPNSSDNGMVVSTSIHKLYD